MLNNLLVNCSICLKANSFTVRLRFTEYCVHCTLVQYTLYSSKVNFVRVLWLFRLLVRAALSIVDLSLNLFEFLINIHLVQIHQLHLIMPIWPIFLLGIITNRFYLHGLIIVLFVNIWRM